MNPGYGFREGKISSNLPFSCLALRLDAEHAEP
jgi:hypothetical protein